MSAPGSPSPSETPAPKASDQDAVPPDARTRADELLQTKSLHDLFGEALVWLDEALSSRPIRNGDAFTAATQALAVYREAVIKAQREHPAPGDRDRLSKLSAVIAVVIAGHYPMGATLWGDLDKARLWFMDLKPAE